MANTRKTVTLSEDKFNEIMKGLEQIKVQLAERNHIDEMVKDDHALLLGNGKMGFVAVRDEVASWKEDKKHYVRVVIGYILIQAFSLAVAAFVWFAQIYPVIESIKEQRLGMLP